MTRREETLLGWLGLIGAVLVGLGECYLQFSPGGDYTDPSYSYFAGISEGRLSLGHYLGVLAAPLYLAGYGFVASIIRPAGQFSARAVFIIGAAAFMIGAVWYGQRAFIALAVQDAPGLVDRFAHLNEPLVNVLRLAMVAVAIIWARALWSGKTSLPRWMVAISPLTLLVLIFAMWATAPNTFGILLASAMNLAHAVFFALCLALRKAQAS